MDRTYLLLLALCLVMEAISECINPCGWEGGYQGYCVNAQGQDSKQTTHVYPRTDPTTLSAAKCLEWCKSVPGADGCEQTDPIHVGPTEGCHIHISSADPNGPAFKGKPSPVHYCWTFPTVAPTPSTQFTWYTFEQCVVPQTQYDDDLGVDDPLFVQEGQAINSSVTLAGCKARCIGAVDLHERPCVGVEWYDGGSVLPPTEKRSCHLLWGCDDKSDWAGGSTFLLPTVSPTTSPTFIPSTTPLATPTTPPSTSNPTTSTPTFNPSTTPSAMPTTPSSTSNPTTSTPTFPPTRAPTSNPLYDSESHTRVPTTIYMTWTPVTVAQVSPSSTSSGAESSESTGGLSTGDTIGIVCGVLSFCSGGIFVCRKLCCLQWKTKSEKEADDTHKESTLMRKKTEERLYDYVKLQTITANHLYDTAKIEKEYAHHKLQRVQTDQEQEQENVCATVNENDNIRGLLFFKTKQNPVTSEPNNETMVDIPNMEEQYGFGL